MLGVNAISLCSLILVTIFHCSSTESYCPPLKRKQGVDLKCYEPFSFPETNISCFRQYFKPGTKVSYKCKIPFLPTRIGVTNDSESSGKLECTSTGTWKGLIYYTDFNCDADCGFTTVPARARRSSPIPLILGGEKVENAGEWPWQAVIYIRESSSEKFQNKCGGTLIWVGKVFMILTAGHCLMLRGEATREMSDIKVVLGAKFLNLDANQHVDHAQFFNVIKIIVHPQYYPTPLLFHDVGLLLLDKDVELNKYVIPACIPNPENKVNLNDIGFVVGFGKDESGNQPNELRKVGLKVTNPAFCSEWRDAYKRLNSDELCVGYNSTGKGVCNGDSGSGLVFYEKYRDRKRFVLKGLVSYTAVDNVSRQKVCDYYSVFTNVVAYVDWIKEVAEEFYNYYYNYKEPLETWYTQRQSFSRTKSELTTTTTTTLQPPQMSQNLDFFFIALEKHNFYRRRHQVGDVHIKSRLTAYATDHANYLLDVGHLQATWTPEINMNTFAYNTSRSNINFDEIVKLAVDSWYSKVKEYDWNNPSPSSFTQIVWKETIYIGVGLANKGKKTVVVVCYSPSGNKKGENGYYFKQNVFPATNLF